MSRYLLVPVALRLAARELRGARRGFGIFLACLTLGVMAIAGIGSFARALTEGLAREGQVILGGDAAFALVQRQASLSEMAVLAGGGQVSVVANLRAMARTPSGEATLVELKAVDGAYPLFGRLDIVPDAPLDEVLGRDAETYGALADETLMARLDLSVGSRLKLGQAEVRIAGVIRSEPDRLSTGIGFGPRLLVSKAALEATGLVQPGSVVRWTYRVRLNDPQSLPAFLAQVKASAPQAGFEVRSREAAAPQLERDVRRITQYLTLVGLTALLVGGVGVANAVIHHLAAKRETIATLKALGAPRGVIFTTYFAQVTVLAALGISGGLVLGAALPFFASAVLSGFIPFPLAPRLDLSVLALAALYGGLVTCAFTLWPLARAQETPVAALFRDGAGAGGAPPRRYAVLCVFALIVMAALAFLSAQDLRTALVFLGSAAAVCVVLRLLALAIMALARRLPRPRDAMARLALTNIYRPGALTPTVTLSLGLGLTLLTAISLIDHSLTVQLTGTLARKAPSFFFIDVPSSEEAQVRAFLAQQAPDALYESVPMLRGRITALNGVPVEQARPTPDAAWVLQSDRGISFSDQVPEGSVLAQGRWWSPGEPEALVSFERKLAQGLGLAIGDSVRVNVLGREITARISNLRDVNWQRLGINFVMVFSPATFAGAPYSLLASLTFPQGASTAQEVMLLKQMAAQFPAVTTIRVKEALDQANQMFGTIALGIRIASLVTLLTSVLVLAGALAAGHQHRVYDAVILKTLGATRLRLMGAYAMEYAMLGIVTALFSVAAGALAAYGVTTRIMSIDFAFAPSTAAFVVGLALALTLGFGLLGTWRALSQPPARVLRHL